MALANATITYDISDLTGADFDARRTKVWVTTNIDGDTVIDTAGNAIRVGDGLGSIADDGTGSVSVWVPGAGSNPTTWQTYVHLDYAQRRPGAARVQQTFGPFTVTTSANLADLIAEQAVPPTYLSQVTAQLQGYVDAAQAAAQQAQDVSGFDTSDDLVAGLVADDDSDTRAALATTFASYDEDGVLVIDGIPVELGSGGGGSISLKPYDDCAMAIIGDSRDAGGWPGRARVMLSAGTLTNLAVSGETWYAPGAGIGITSHIDEIPDNVDLIILGGGINDFRTNAPLGTIADTVATTSFYGALRAGLTQAIADNPTADIYFTTPFNNTETGGTPNWITPNGSGKTLGDYRKAMHDVANLFGVGVITVGEHAQVGGPYSALTTGDNLHPNTEGEKRIAAYVAGFLNGTTQRYELNPPPNPDPDPPEGTTYSNVRNWSSDTSILYVASGTPFPELVAGQEVVIVSGNGFVLGTYTISTFYSSFNFDGVTTSGFRLTTNPGVVEAPGGVVTIPDL